MMTVSRRRLWASETLELFRVSVSTDADDDWRLHIGATLAEHSGHNIRMLWAEHPLID